MHNPSLQKIAFTGIFLCSLFTGYSQTLFYQSFDTTWTTIASLPGWSGTSSPANSTWHKNSYTTGWSSGSTGAYSQGGASGTSFSARFHSCGAASGALGNIITPSINCSVYGGNKKLSFYYMNGSSGTDELDVFVSYNGGLSWSSSLLRLRQSSGWIRYTIPLGKTSVTNLKIKFEGNQGGSAGSSDIGVDEITVMSYTQSYTGLPYTQDFEAAWTGNNSTRDIPDLYWTNCPETKDASWRRQDDGASASWGSSSTGLVTPAWGSYSADFHSYNAVSGHFGYLDLYADFSDAGSKQLTFNYQNTSPSDQLSIYLSIDGGQTFGPALATLSTGTWSGQVVELESSTSSYCVIRFLAVSDKGYDDIGIDNVGIEVLSPLPLELWNFSAQQDGRGVRLSWETGSQNLFERFISERSLDGVHFESISDIAGREREILYSMHDNTPPGLVYYRLKYIKYHGSAGYSNTVVLKRPFSDRIVITSIPGGLCRVCFHDAMLGKATVVIYDLYGRAMRSSEMDLPEGSACEEISGNGLGPGIYLLKASLGNEQVIGKIGF